MKDSRLGQLKFIIKTHCFLFFLFCNNRSFAQCDSSYFSVTTTTNHQTINGLTITLASPTNAQATRLLNETITGYYIGDENISEEINFSLSQPVRRIKIIGRALSAYQNKIEYFTLKVNGQHHIIQPS